MSTMEHLFMQIFNRKHWIEDQLRHHADSYGQSIASNLLAEGFCPPPWLWTSGSDGHGCPDPKELNRKQLISEILDPLPRVNTPANNNSFSILPTLKGKKVNLSSSDNAFTKTCASNKYFEVMANNELVSNDVPEGSKQHSETMVEPEVTEDYSKLRQTTRTQTSTPMNKEPDMSPSKKAKIVKHPVEENTLQEFTGRVTRSMATCLNCDYFKDNCKGTQSKSSAQKYSFVDEASKLAKSQQDVLSVPSASIENRAHNSSVANDLYLDAAYAADNGCQIKNSLSSRLPASTLLSDEPEHCFDGIELPAPNNSSVSDSKAKNHTSTSDVSLLETEATDVFACPDSFTSSHLNEDFLHILGTIRRIEAADIDPTEGPIKEMCEVKDPERSTQLTCHDCKPSVTSNSSSFTEDACQNSKNAPVPSFHVSDCTLNDFSSHVKELQVDSRKSAIGSLQRTPEEHCNRKMIEVPGPDLDFSVSNDMCDLNKNLIDDSVKASNNSLEASLKKLNSALKDGLIPRVSKSADTSMHQKIVEEDVSDTVKTLLQRVEVHGASNGGSEEGCELPVGNSECISHPTSYSKDCWIFENALSNSSPEKGYLLNSTMDSSGHLSDLSIISRKRTFRSLVQCAEEEECYTKPKEVLIDVKFVRKSEGSYPVETVPLSSMEECDSSQNFVADLDVADKVSDDDQIERSDIIRTRDCRCHSHFPVYSTNSLLSAIPLSKENVIACSSPNTGNMLNSARGLSVQPDLIQDNDKEMLLEIPMQFTDGEKCTEKPDIQTAAASPGQRDSVHFDDQMLHFSETNEVLMGAEEIENSAEEVMQRSIAKSIASQRQEAMLEGKRVAEEIGIANDRITPATTKMCDAVPKSRYFLRSSTSNDKHYALPKSSRIDYSRNSKHKLDRECDGTWPKRKKLKGRLNNVLATSPRLRTKMHKHIEEQIDCSCRTSLNNTTGSSDDVPPFMLSHEVELEVELSEAALGQFEEEHLSKKRRIMEDDHDLTGKCQAVKAPLSIKHTDELFLDLADEDSSSFTESTILNLEKYDVSQDRQDSLDSFDNGSPVKFGSTEESTDEGQKYARERILYAGDSTGLSQQYNKILDGVDETMPEFERFSISVPPILEEGVIFNDSEIPCLSKERASLLEQLCRSESMFAAKSCPLSKYNIHKIPDPYYSLPAGVLEQLNFSNSLCINGIDVNQFRTAKDDKKIDSYCSLGSELDGCLLRSHPCKFPSSNSESPWEARKPPLTPPVEKLQQRMISRKSVATSQELGSNPELVCFRIDENSCTTEEESASEMGVRSRGVQMSKNRIALADVTSIYQNMPISVSECGKHLERGSLDSSNAMPQLDMDYEENDNPLASSVHGSANSSRNWFNKPDISGKTNGRNKVRSVSGKGGKPNNIVSNISSFMPLVREKQQTAALGIGKRGIKVKALEAAEAVKRLEEKRQYEREMKKAAAKLERVRLEQENVRQLELKQKEKEELRKKKEADFEARKRQREVDRIEKEKKRQCIEETRKQQRVNVDILRIEKHAKGLRHQNANEKKRKARELSKEAKKQAPLAKEIEVAACRNTAEVKPSISKVVSGDSRRASSGVEAHGALETNDSDKRVNNSYELQIAIQDRMSVTAENRDLQAYEISPYKDSDCEDGDEDHMCKRKCIPSWARKESLDLILLSNRHLDPVEIFSRKSSFDLCKVLLTQLHR